MDSNRINKLASIIDSQIDKNNYLLARYLNDISVDIRSSMEFSNYTAYAFDFKQDSDLYKSACSNVIKACIDTLTSKISSQKARPYFNSINGTYKTKQIIRQAQEFFDCMFDEQEVNLKVSQAFRNACIFGIGYLWINPFTFDIEVLPPWTVGISNAETGYGKATDCLIKFNNYPTSLLKEKYGTDYVQFCYYVNVKEHKAYKIVNGKTIETIKFDGTKIPLVPVYYTKPIFGNRTVSLVEELDGIQTQIDLINSKISAASQLTPGNVTYVMEGSSLDSTMLNNKTGTVYPVKLLPGMNSLPVMSVTPAPFDPMWQNLLDYNIKMAFEMIGISQLSAMSKKPSGLDSGVSLQTMEDIESDRFETQVNHYINAFVLLAKSFIDVIPEDAEIVAPSYMNSSFTWKDLKAQSNLFKVQYSCATALSKDPAEKLKQVLQLSQIGLIGADKIATYLDAPDLEDAYSGAQAIFNAISKCITKAIEEEDYDIPEFINYQPLAQQIAIVENQLYASLSDDKKANKDVIESLSRVQKLEENLMAIMEENGFIETETTDAETQTADSGLAAGNVNQALMANDITTQINPDEQLNPDEMEQAPEMMETNEDIPIEQGAEANPVEI